MLFAHSLTGNGLRGEPFYAPLVEQGWQVLAMDQRGHGEAPRETDPAGFALAAMATDLVDVLDDAGWDTAWFAGGSMGAATALAAAVQVPQRVEGLALMAPAVGRTTNAGAPMFQRIADGFAGGGMAGGVAAWRQEMGALGATDADLDGQEAELRLLAGPDNLACLLATMPRWTMADELDAVSQFDVPVVVLAWDGDDVHPMALAEEIAASAKHGRLLPVTSGDPLALFQTLAAALPA
jgi:pimeloyl-ACP methyl ester carboxylesterase